MELRAYITNMGLYNEGVLKGEWITFPIDDDELSDVLKRIGCYYVDDAGKEHNLMYEEYFFSDFECDIDDCPDFSEYESIETLNEYAEKLEGWDDTTLSAACDIWGLSEVLEHDPDDYVLYTDINDNYDLGYYYACELACIDFGRNEILERYFDFESYGRDISYEVNGGFTAYGYIEYMG